MINIPKLERDDIIQFSGTSIIIICIFVASVGFDSLMIGGKSFGKYDLIMNLTDSTFPWVPCGIRCKLMSELCSLFMYHVEFIGLNSPVQVEQGAGS